MPGSRKSAMRCEVAGDKEHLIADHYIISISISRIRLFAKKSDNRVILIRHKLRADLQLTCVDDQLLSS